MAIIQTSRKLDRSRRKVLMQLGMATTAFGLAGPAMAQGASNDAGLIASEIWMEGVAIDLYAFAAENLSSELKPVAELFGDHHAQHLAEAQRAALSIGLPEPPKRIGVQIEPTGQKSDADILAFALRTETQAVFAYEGLITQMSGADLRGHTMAIYASEVGHVIALRAALEGMELGAPIQSALPAFSTGFANWAGYTQPE